MNRYVSPSTLQLTASLTIAQTHGFLLEHINSHLQSGKTGGLIFAHFKEPDEFGHLYGMGSSQWDNSVVQLDQILGEAVALLTCLPQFGPNFDARERLITDCPRIIA